MAADEVLTIVSLSTEISEDVIQCVEESLRDEAPGLNVMPSRQFRNSFFPWFEPNTAPHSDEDLALLMDRDGVRQHVSDLGLRYVVSLSGRTYTVGKNSWGGCVGGYAGAACVTGMEIETQTDLTAAIHDFTSSRSVGEISATGAGTSAAGVILLLPYVVFSSAEADTCRALAKRINAFVTGASSEHEQSIGE
jgi:hypothetical protein